MKKEQIAIGVLVIFHIIGSVGMSTDYRPLMVSLTPVNLLLCLIMIIWAEKSPKQKAFIYAFLACFAIGLGIEILGVNTGFPFGEYGYGPAFGPQLLGTPFLIGVNWFLMIYGSTYLAKCFSNNKLLVSVLAGLIVILLDIALEPVAVSLGYWQWSGGFIPLQNYATWMIFTSLMSYLITRLHSSIDNKVAGSVVIIQFVFFLVLNQIL